MIGDSSHDRARMLEVASRRGIERTIAGAPRKRREAVRQEKAKPIVEAFFQWCDAEADRVLDESPIADAIRYARNQRVALARFLNDGRLPIHNNSSELNLRREVVGRRNWIFCGSDDGAETNTIFVSLLESCQLHQIEPLAYLRDLLCLLPSWPRHQILNLAPAYWTKTLTDEAVQRKLAANVFRRVVLSVT